MITAILKITKRLCTSLYDNPAVVYCKPFFFFAAAVASVVDISAATHHSEQVRCGGISPGGVTLHPTSTGKQLKTSLQITDGSLLISHSSALKSNSCKASCWFIAAVSDNAGYCSGNTGITSTEQLTFMCSQSDAELMLMFSSSARWSEEEMHFI